MSDSRPVRHSQTPLCRATPELAQRDADRLRRMRERHWTMLAVSVLIVVLAFVMETRTDGRVSFAGMSRFPLPELCSSRILFGATCPGCGLTRSIIALAVGDLATSLRYHRVGWLIALALVLQIPYRLYALRELRIEIRQRSWPKWFGILLIAALLINWFADVAGGGSGASGSGVPKRSLGTSVAVSQCRVP